MVDSIQLAVDTVGNLVVLVLPALLWLFLYRFVWEDAAVAQDIGFGRLVFWLLLLGGIISIVANLPLFALNGDVLAVNLGGALFPVLVSALLLHRAYQDRGRPLSLFFLGLVGGVGAAFLALILLGDSVAAPFAMALGLLVPALILLAAPGVRPDDHALALSSERASLTLLITVGVILFTFLTTMTIPQEGIVSAFPLYLVAPIVAGVVAVLVARAAFRLPARFGLAIAYATATFGVLLGADLYRQPPLYNSGGQIYSIGGAGALDLVALSGPLAMAAAFLVYRWLRADEPAPPPANYGKIPAHVLNRSIDAYVAHDAARAIAWAREAAQASAAQSRQLLGDHEPALPARPWVGMAVPSWVEADQANLDALARASTIAPVEAYRAVQTARWLTRLGHDLSRGRFATVGRRSLAYSIDLALVTGVGVLIWVALALAIPPSDLLSSVAFNAAAVGFSALAFLYFALTELLYGATVGKQLLGLRVTDRRLHSPGLLESLVRNTPKVVPLTVIGYAGAIATAFLINAGSGSDAATNILTGTAIALGGVVGVFLCGLVGVAAILMTSEHQRLGDYLAGTWVVTAAAPTPATRGVPAAVGAAQSA